MILFNRKCLVRVEYNLLQCLKRESQRNEITSKKLRWSLTTTLSVTDDRACNVVVILSSAPQKCTSGGRNIQIKGAN